LKTSSANEIGVIDLFKPTGEKVKVLRRGHFPNTAIVEVVVGQTESNASAVTIKTEVYLTDLKRNYAASNK
jgi:hypothetical protein